MAEEINDKKRLEIIENIVRKIDSLAEEKKAINEEILASELGSDRKKINSQISKLKVALDDAVNKNGYFDPREGDIDQYMETRKAHTGPFMDDPEEIEE
jgi:uncharacterized coiled-coil DUF342 family protein